MKFGKIVSLYLFVYISIITNSTKLKLRSNYNLSNLNNKIEFIDMTNTLKPLLPNIMENVINSKSKNIILKTGENARFIETENLDSKIYNNLVEKNMETPVIIRKSSSDSTFNDIKTRVAMNTPQTISNSDGFDAIYKDHKVNKYLIQGLL